MVFSPRMTRLCTFACSINNHMLIRQLLCFLFFQRLYVCDLFIRHSKSTADHESGLGLGLKLLEYR